MSKNILNFLLAAVLIAVSAPVTNAQPYKLSFQENRERAAGIYHYYEYVPSPQTPAPKGFKPFYISHYGRHGSRYHSGAGYFGPALKGLDTCRADGLLSPEGERLWQQLDTLFGEHQGMFGMLTERGAQEHRAIGRRLLEYAPEVFRSRKGRNEIDAVSSYWPRCLVSMTNFTTALQERTDGLVFHYATGPKYLDYISMNLNMDGVTRRSNSFVATLKAAKVPYDRFFSALFSNPQRALERIPDPEGFMRSVFESGCISPNTEHRPDIFSHFTDDELAGEWILHNDKMYYRYGISAEEGDIVRAIAKPLIADIVARADEAVRPGSRRAADLRFGHDVGLLPLIGTIGIRGMERPFPSADVHTHWFSFEMIPMASNLQLIFYRNRKGDILVKLRYNEQETTIPALQTATGPYYRWEDLRAYLVRTETEIPGDRVVRDSAQTERNGTRY